MQATRILSKGLRRMSVAGRCASVAALKSNNGALFHTVCRSSQITSARMARIAVPHARMFSAVTENLESLGDSITSAVLLSWNKKAGDAIAEDDVIAVVETDKVTMDIRAKKSGMFVEGLVEANGEISVGAPLYKMDTSKSGSAPKETSKGSAEKAAPAAESPKEESKPKSAASGKITTIPVPIMGESITSGILSSWTVSTGEVVAADHIVATVETDKVNVEVRSPSGGKITKLYSQEGDEVKVGESLFDLEETNEEPSKSKSATSSSQKSPEPAKSSTSSSAPPAAAAAPAPKKESKPAADNSSSAPAPAPVGDRTETRVKMTRMRQRISQRLKEAQNTAAMLTTFQEVDMGPLMDMRNLHKEEFEKTHGVKLGFMSAFVRACTVALQEIPAINAVIDDATNEIVYRNYVDVSVAVASPNGLVVPVLRNTEKMSFADVEKTIGHFGKKAKEGKMALEDMSGGTFTISNGGVFGSLFGTPIINPPQSAILGMHATKMRAVVNKEGKVEARPMMYLALTYDHRMIDGREAVTFLMSVKKKIEDPGRLLLSL